MTALSSGDHLPGCEGSHLPGDCAWAIEQRWKFWRDQDVWTCRSFPSDRTGIPVHSPGAEGGACRYCGQSEDQLQWAREQRSSVTLEQWVEMKRHAKEAEA